MSQIYTSEQYTFLFKTTFDILSYINYRSEEANGKYDDLVNKFDQYIVLSNSVDGRTSQLINISTNFGAEDPNDPGVKEFTFNEGSVLRYKRTLPSTHKDEYEVVNFKTLINLLTTATNNLGSDFLSNTGDTAIGSYTFTPSIGGSTITFDSVSVVFTNNVIDIEQGILQTVFNNSLSLINKAYLDTYYTKTQNLNIQPIFTSGKIALLQTDDQAIIRSKGQYDIEFINSLYNEKIISVKLLKYNAKTAWDTTDHSWVELFGNTVIGSIPGNTLASAINTIPYPIDYSIYLEYNTDPTLYPFTNYHTSSRIRTELNNVNFMPIIDSDGDLTLVCKTNFKISIPFTDQEISLNCNSSANPILYLIVRKWSYIPKDQLYLDDSIDPDPVLLFTNKTWMRTYGTSGSVVVRYRLLYKNIHETINWSSNSALSISYGSDTIGDYADITIPVGETTYNITFTATLSGSTINKTVSLQLRDYVYEPMQLSPNTIYYDRYNTLPSTYPISFNCILTGGQGTKTPSIINDSDTTLTSAAIDSNYNITGNYTTPNVDVYAKVKVVDSTYTSTNNTFVAGTGTISSNGTTVTLDGDTVNTPVNSYITADGQIKKIVSITNSTTFVIDTAFSTNLPSLTSFTIAIKTLSSNGTDVTLTNDTTSNTPIGSYITIGSEVKRVVTTPTSETLTIDSAFASNKPNGTTYIVEVGQVIKKIAIHLNELLDNPDESAGKYTEV